MSSTTPFTVLGGLLLITGLIRLRRRKIDNGAGGVPVDAGESVAMNIFLHSIVAVASATGEISDAGRQAIRQTTSGVAGEPADDATVETVSARITDPDFNLIFEIRATRHQIPEEFLTVIKEAIRTVAAADGETEGVRQDRAAEILEALGGA